MTGIYRFETLSIMREYLPLLNEGEVAVIPNCVDELYLVGRNGPRRIKACAIDAALPGRIVITKAMIKQRNGVTDALLEAERKAMAGGSHLNSVQVKQIHRDLDAADIHGYVDDRIDTGKLAEARKPDVVLPRGSRRIALQHRRRLKAFRPAMMDRNPARLLGDEGVAELHVAAMNAFWDLVSLADYHPRLGVVAIKVAERLMRGLEEVQHACHEEADRMKADILALGRGSIQSEIDHSKIERCEQRIDDMRLQWWHVTQLLGVFMNEYEVLRMKLDVNFQPYRTQAERYALSASQRKSKQLRREFDLSQLKAKSPKAYEEWKKWRLEYEPAIDGTLSPEPAAGEATPEDDDDGDAPRVTGRHREDRTPKSDLKGRQV